MGRVLISAIKSSSGKTMVTCGLLRLFKDRGMEVSALKSGPDYIDPMFHRKILGIKSGNIDPYFCDHEELRKVAAEAETAGVAPAGQRQDAANLLLIEGAMGIYDGITGRGKRASCYETARETETPIVLLVDAAGMGRTILSVIKGILMDDTDGLIKGVIINRMSPAYYEKLKPFIDQTFNNGLDAHDETTAHAGWRQDAAAVGRSAAPKVRFLGALPRIDGVTFDSRHLGLMMPDEMSDISEKIGRVSEVIAEHIDIEGLVGIAESAPELAFESSASGGSKEADTAHQGTSSPDSTAPPMTGLSEGNLTLAVARDDAFCFYYERNIKAFEDRGVRVKYFSPLEDEGLPEGVNGLLLPGGYPELFAEKLEKNESMRKAVAAAVADGMPSLAECGGYMYLLDAIRVDGKRYEMCGVVHREASNTGAPVRFGYCSAIAREGKGRYQSGAVHRRSRSSNGGDDLPPTAGRGRYQSGAVHRRSRSLNGGNALLNGLKIRGHEFHYYDTDGPGEDGDCEVRKGAYPDMKRRDLHMGEDHLWGFPHFYYPSCPEFVDRFIERMREYEAREF